jgi:gentisate 1,2-dioxygenase
VHWDYTKIRPTLLEAGSIVGAKEAERRVLMLENPQLGAPYTTDTIYGGLQLVLPGEIAPAHRHVAFALRFIIEGTGGFTAVEGQKIHMQRGDVILTPSWQWHDHGNEGSEPVIWLDGLDLPLYRHAKVNFAENYTEQRYPSESTAESPLQFPWVDVQQNLDAKDGDHAVFHYRNADGSWLSKTLGAQAERLRFGRQSGWSQQTTSFVYHVYEGEGYTEMIVRGNGATKTVWWKAGDTFAVPAWTRIRHFAPEVQSTARNSDVYLFAINDRPMLEVLGLFRDAC